MFRVGFSAFRLSQPSLYELADIDRDRYTILAVDLSIDSPVTATVYAVDESSMGSADTARSPS